MIKSKTVYTKELLDEFSNYIIKKNKSLIVIYVCAAIILVCSIAMFCLHSLWFETCQSASGYMSTQRDKYRSR